VGGAVFAGVVALGEMVVDVAANLVVVVVAGAAMLDEVEGITPTVTAVAPGRGARWALVVAGPLQAARTAAPMSR
jgi:hypothetical protein